jgi:hypothetical protein
MGRHSEESACRRRRSDEKSLFVRMHPREIPRCALNEETNQFVKVLTADEFIVCK